MNDEGSTSASAAKEETDRLNRTSAASTDPRHSVTLDGDGDLEVVVAAADGHVYALAPRRLGPRRLHRCWSSTRSR
ncbi:MAG: hypothetical protein R2716_05705 [Microthrixaceae bacterium]